MSLITYKEQTRVNLSRLFNCSTAKYIYNIYNLIPGPMNAWLIDGKDYSRKKENRINRI
jgi:hypothetical protein